MKRLDIECNSKYVDCSKVVKWLGDFSFTSGGGIFIEDSAKLIDQFAGDEEVAFDFEEEGYIAKTREMDSPAIAQILVAPDLIWKHDNIDVEDQVVISALHEEAHVRGIKSEKKAEDWAYAMYRDGSRSFQPRLSRRT